MKNFENPVSIESTNEKLEVAKKSLTLSAALLALTASMAEAQGESKETVLNCLEDTTSQNFELVKDRFPELNEKIAAFAEARDAAMDKSDYEAAADIGEDMEEMHSFRYDNFAYIVQMKDYCENELANLEVIIAQADAQGTATSDLEQKQEILRRLVEDLEEVKEGYKDM